MLALLGAATVLTLLAVIMLNLCSPLVALIAVPAVAAVIGGFGLGAAQFMVDGITHIAPVAAMFVFAIIYFGVMTDAGLLDPIIDGILRAVGGRPTYVVLGTALLALLVHLDGSGAVCFLVTIPAMLPLYEKLKMDRRILAGVASLAAGVNVLPWTGPTMRSSAALHIPALEIFRPMIGVEMIGLIFVFAVAYWLGRREEKRLGFKPGQVKAEGFARALTPHEVALRRPNRFWFNVVLTVALMATMISGVVKEPAIVFMIGAVTALIVNYPSAAQQRARVDAHAKAALLMAGILLAAGAFTGILTGSGMLTAMTQAAVSHIPLEMGRHIPVALAVIAMPLSLIFDPDSFYFGVMPVVAEVTRSTGGQPIQVVYAALMGQHTVGFPVSPLTPSTFLVVGLAGIELREHQKFTIPFLYAASLIMTVAALAFGLFPL